MRKRLLLLSLFSVLTFGMKAADYDYLVFTLTDGTTQSIAATGTSISYSDGTLTATNGTSTVTIPLTSIAKMAFSDDPGTTSIVSIDVDALSMDTSAIVYDLQGRRVPKEHLHPGIYIVKTGTKAYKIAVR